MSDLIHGALYLYKGELRSHKGGTGIASNITRIGRNSSCTLSNIKDWGAWGLATSIEAMDYELQLVADHQERPGKNAKPEDLAFDGPESDLVESIIAAVTERGYVLCSIGQRNTKGSGTTIGYPDLSVRRSGWPCGMTCLIEVKTKDGRLSPDQQKLFNAGWSYVVWSVDGALEALEAFDEQVAQWHHWSHHKPTKERTEL